MQNYEMKAGLILTLVCSPSSNRWPESFSNKKELFISFKGSIYRNFIPQKKYIWVNVVFDQSAIIHSETSQTDNSI